MDQSKKQINTERLAPDNPQILQYEPVNIHFAHTHTHTTTRSLTHSHPTNTFIIPCSVAFHWHFTATVNGERLSTWGDCRILMQHLWTAPSQAWHETSSQTSNAPVTLVSLMSSEHSVISDVMGKHTAGPGSPRRKGLFTLAYYDPQIRGVVASAAGSSGSLKVWRGEF